MSFRGANTRSRAFLGVFLVNVQVILESLREIFSFHSIVVHEFTLPGFPVYPLILRGVDNLWIKLQLSEAIVPFVYLPKR